MALLCRQQAVLHPDQNWKWLGQAERWEHLAHALVRKTKAAQPSDVVAAA